MAYCSSCSKEVVAGLIFCNHCGFKLKDSGDKAKTTVLPFIALVFGIVSVFVIGFGCIIGILAMMKNLGFRDEMIGIVIVLCFATIFFVEAMFMWLLFKRNRLNTEERNVYPVKENSQMEQPVSELYTAPKRVLNESTIEPIPSITEHTTRTLEHTRKGND